MMEPTDWRKSTFSASGNCVEIGDGAMIGVGDTKEKHLGSARTILRFSPSSWSTFTTELKNS